MSIIMASERVECDKSQFLCKDSVKLALQKFLLSDRFIIEFFDLRPASNELLGFLGDHFKLHIGYVLDGVRNDISFFVKSSPRQIQFRIEFGRQYRFFERESFIYKDIFSQLKTENDTEIWHPTCLLNLGDDLIFEDLHSKGFKMLKLGSSMDREHCIVVLKSLVRLHASSIIIEESKSNKKIYRLEDEHSNIFDGGNFGYNSWFKTGVESCMAVAGESLLYGKETSHFEIVKAKWHQVFKEGILLCSLSKDTRNVICHSDLWNNNLMFRHDEDGKPVQCVLVDFQGVRLIPPAADVMSLIYMNLDKPTREKYEPEIISHYYNELSRILNDNNITLKNILPWETFQKSCNIYRKWGLVHSIILFQFIFTDSEDAFILNEPDTFRKLVEDYKGDKLVKKIKDDITFLNRIMPNVEDLIDLYIV